MADFSRITDRFTRLRGWLGNAIGRSCGRGKSASGNRSEVPTQDKAKTGSDRAGMREGETLIFSEDFDGDLSNWIQDGFIRDSLHRTKYKHLELDGSVNTSLDHIKVPGRHAALMDRHREKVQYIENGVLVMRGYVEKAKNIYRKNFNAPDGRLQPYGDNIISTSWLSGWGRRFDNKLERHVTDWSRTKLPLIGPGSRLVIRINLEALCMSGGRFSAWRMPATRTEDTPDNPEPAEVVCDQSYNEDPTVKETDLLENENPIRFDSQFGQRALMKCVGGEAGDTPNGDRNLLTDFGINIRKDWHEIELVHHFDGTLDFKCDGKLINHESRPELNWGYVVLSCEFSSGVKKKGTAAPHESEEDGPYQPANAGLSGRSCIDDIDMIEKHQARVDYVRAYRLKAA